MGPRFEQLFMIPCVGCASLLVAWLALALTTDLGKRAGFGILGSLLASLLFGALWQADQVEWLWMAGAARAVPLAWAGIALLNGFALVSGRGSDRRGRWTAIALGGVGFALHAFGGILFLWAATFSV